jgi:PAS domain-containing protein
VIEQVVVRLLRESALALRERKRILDVFWLSSLVGISAAVAVLWFFHVLELELSPVAWSVFGYLLLYVSAAVATDQLRRRRAMRVAVELLQMSGVLFLALLWHFVGGVDNPLFLLAFFLPVMASGALLFDRQPLRLAGLSVAAVSLVALSESRELRWFVLQLGLPVERIVRLPDGVLPGRPEPFPGMETGPAFQFAFLLLFALFLFGTAFLSAALPQRLLRLLRRLHVSVSAQLESGDLLQSWLRAAPVPTVLVAVADGQVLHLSRSFVNQLLLDPADLPGKTLFDLVSFSDPLAVGRLLAKGSGELPFSVYRVGAETRIARVRIDRIRHGGTNYASVSLRDRNELFYLRRALEEIEVAFLVVRADGALAYSNAAARQFGEFHFGMDAAALLGPLGGAPDWWRTPSEAETRVEIRGRTWDVRRVLAGATGSPDALTVLTFSESGRTLGARRKAS